MTRSRHFDNFHPLVSVRHVKSEKSRLSSYIICEESIHISLRLQLKRRGWIWENAAASIMTWSDNEIWVILSVQNIISGPITLRLGKIQGFRRRKLRGEGGVGTPKAFSILSGQGIQKFERERERERERESRTTDIPEMCIISQKMRAVLTNSDWWNNMLLTWYKRPCLLFDPIPEGRLVTWTIPSD